jgi:hypothetical protein
MQVLHANRAGATQKGYAFNLTLKCGHIRCVDLGHGPRASKTVPTEVPCATCDDGHVFPDGYYWDETMNEGKGGIHDPRPEPC